jgi:hypothetical protein
MFNGGENTQEQKGTKHVQMLGLEDKRKIIMVVSFSVVGNLLPLQTVFTNITFISTKQPRKGKLHQIWLGPHLH